MVTTWFIFLILRHHCLSITSDQCAVYSDCMTHWMCIRTPVYCSTSLVRPCAIVMCSNRQLALGMSSWDACYIWQFNTLTSLVVAGRLNTWSTKRTLDLAIGRDESFVSKDKNELNAKLKKHAFSESTHSHHFYSNIKLVGVAIFKCDVVLAWVTNSFPVKNNS